MGDSMMRTVILAILIDSRGHYKIPDVYISVEAYKTMHPNNDLEPSRPKAICDYEIFDSITGEYLGYLKEVDMRGAK